MKKKGIETTFCLICDKDVSYTIKSIKEKRVIKGKEIIYDAEHAFCNECGEFLFIYEIERRNQIKAFDEYKRLNNLLTSEEIINIRKKYNLSQTAFAKYIKCGEKNIARYESGAIQEASINLLIILFDKFPEEFGYNTAQNNKLNLDQKVYFVNSEENGYMAESVNYQTKTNTKRKDNKIWALA